MTQVENKKGSLICVGTGMRMAGQLTPYAQSCIESADVVVSAVPNIFMRQWLKGISKDYICLLHHYEAMLEDGQNRGNTYFRMKDTIMEHLHQGKNVCAVFYGHPGIFACIGHMAIKQARAEGYTATMEAAVSALDCLVADLGLDFGDTGMQTMEATQFTMLERPIDTSSLVILWQIGLGGDLSMKVQLASQAQLQLTLDKLARFYSLDHEVILYEAATHPLEKTRIEHIQLRSLTEVTLKQITTLVIPPQTPFVKDIAFIQKAKELQKQIINQSNKETP